MNTENQHTLHAAWTALSSERQEYWDLLRDYIPRGQQHFKLKREFGNARLSIRSMETIQLAAKAGDQRAVRLLAGVISDFTNGALN